MSDTVVLETTTKYGNARTRKETYHQFTAHPAHSYGVFMAIVWLVTTAVLGSSIFLLRKTDWFYTVSSLHVTDDEFLFFWGVWGIVTTYISYMAFFHVKKYDLRNEWLDYVNLPVEITEREIQEATSRLDISSTGTNANNAAIMNHGQEIIELNEQPATVGNMKFSSEQMAFLRLRAIKSNHINRNDVWFEMNERGLIEGDYKDHYRMSLALFSHSSRKWVINNRWTPRAYEEFLKVDPPHMEN